MRTRNLATNPKWFFLAVIAPILLTLPLIAHKIQYPITKKVDQTDAYFGVRVPDPYRWLENDNSQDTTEWVQEENKVTFSYLERIPCRMKIRERLEMLINYPRYSAPFRKGQYFFFSKNDGLQNQSVLYVQRGLNGNPEVLLDLNKFSKDGTTRLGAFAVSRDTKYAAYGVSYAGSDWQELYVMELATKKLLPDNVKWAKFSHIAWQGHGFYYSRFEAPEKGRELSSKNENQRVYYHKIDTPQSQDELVYQDPEHPLRSHEATTTEDERFLILYISDGASGKKGNALYFRDDSKGERVFKPIVPTIRDDKYTVINNIGDRFLIETDHNAPNGRVVLLDPKNPNEKDWNEVLPEKPEPLRSAGTAGGKLFASYLKDVTAREYVYSFEGKLENEVRLPGLGTAVGFGGEKDDRFVFYTFTSFTFPATIYRYDIPTQKSSVFRSPKIPGFSPADYETKQEFYTSRDGTRVPMFIVYKNGIKLDGKNPTLLYGYGGFNFTTMPSFSALRLALLEQGFVYASVNVRGGGEYGEKWHEAGTKLKKQNVFDDFIAAAEYLSARRYTSPEHLAIQGASNGGLLVGSVMNQRPELFRVAIPQVGVMDMLRFHKFTNGSSWISDYGSSDNEAEFKAIYKYSPLHNIRAGVRYPATLITTSDHDDRVVPAHSFKYAATLQENNVGDNPILIRIETNSGHGPSNTKKDLDITADIDAFIFYNLGVVPKY